nr:hypothetical protein [Tanacetum cinerariifolium]
ANVGECLFGAAEAGSQRRGCLFGAAEAGSQRRGCLFGAGEAGRQRRGVCLVLPRRAANAGSVCLVLPDSGSCRKGVFVWCCRTAAAVERGCLFGAAGQRQL